MLAGVLAVTAVTIPAGIGAGLALWRPGEASFAIRAGMAAGVGYAALGLISFVLTLFRGLYPLTVFILLASITVALWYVGLRRGSLRDHVAAIKREFDHDPWSLTIGVIVILSFAVIRLGFTTHVVTKPPGFRYWADAVEIADSHGVPSLSLQYGSFYPPTTSKIVLNSFNASMTFLLGADPIRSLPPLLWFGSVGLAAALWSVGRELGLRLTAPLFPVLLVMNRVVFNDEVTKDMGAYRAEIFGRLLACCGLVLAIRALRAKSVPEAAGAGLILALGAGTHLIPTMVVAGMILLYGIALALQTRKLRQVATRGLVVGALAVSGGLLVLIVPAGNIGFSGALARADYDAFRQFEQLDPTTLLRTGSEAEATKPPRPGPWYYPPGTLLRRFMSHAAGFRLPVPAALAVAAITLALAVIIFRRFPARLQPLGFTAAGLGVGLFASTLLFSLRYDVLILASFGARRMGDYNSIPLILIGLAFLDRGFGLFRQNTVVPHQLIAALVVALVTAMILPSARAAPDDATRGRRVIAVVQWVRENTPCNARILANARTAGLFQAATGRVAILEGMAPYLRPRILREAITLLRGARTFLHSPRLGPQFLQREGVSFVLVVNKKIPLGFLTSTLKGSYNGLSEAPFLQPLYRGPGVAMFRVAGVRTSASFSSPIGHPGYRCEPTVAKAAPEYGNSP